MWQRLLIHQGSDLQAFDFQALDFQASDFQASDFQPLQPLDPTSICPFSN
jgi:hypothetical protein